MAAVTARRMITRVLRGINYIARNSTPSPDDSNDALDTLNDMMAGWNLEPMMHGYTFILGAILASSSNGVYTVGPGGDIVTTARPDRIQRISRLTGATVNDLEIPLNPIETDREWQELATKLNPGTQVSAFWYNPTNTLGQLHVYPVPSASGQSILLYLQSRFSFIPTLDTPIDLPDGVNRAIRYNLGLELASEFGKELPALWVQMANDSKAKIKTINIKPGKLELNDVMGVGNSGSGSGYNIFSDSSVVR